MTSEAYLHTENCAGWVEGPDEEERVTSRTAYTILLNPWGNRQGGTTYTYETASLHTRSKERFGTKPPASTCATCP